jgi:type VI secretion system protein VasG
MSLVVSRCTENESGGRMIDAILTNTLLPEISRELLVRTISGQAVQRVVVDAGSEGFIYLFDTVEAPANQTVA